MTAAETRLRSYCQKTSLRTCATEQRGVCAGGKKPTARSINRILKLFESFKIRTASINRILKLFESFKIRTAGRKYFFDTLTAAETRLRFFSCPEALTNHLPTGTIKGHHALLFAGKRRLFWI